MPRSIPRLCPRCRRRRVRNPARYCADCEPEANRQRRDARTPDERYYSTATWQRLRAAKLARTPRCERCGGPGVVAHHRLERRAGGADELANLETLCRTCDAVEHRRGFTREREPDTERGGRSKSYRGRPR